MLFSNVSSPSGPVFVVSTGRSGSTSIARVLSLVDGCACVHEPDPVLVREASEYRYGVRSHEEMADLVRRTRPASIEDGIYCESNQVLSLIIPVLVDIFPNAKFVWLIRNGLDVVASAMQKNWYSGRSERGVSRDDCQPLIQAWIDGRIEGDRCGDVSKTTWTKMSRFERCCWYWSYVNQVIETDLIAHAPDHFVRLRLEDIDWDLGRVIEKLGFRHAIAPSPDRHNPARNRRYHWSEWTDEERSVFERWCGSTMDRIYPSWRTRDGSWKDITYETKGSVLRVLRRDYRLVRWLNGFLASNRIAS